MTSVGSIFKYFLSLGLPILLALIGGTVAILASHFRGIEGRILLLFIFIFAFQLSGLTLVILSKASNLKNGKFSNFGFTGLNKRERFLYVSGYSLLLTTVVLEVSNAFRLGLI